MNVQKLLADLSRGDVSLSVEGDKLRIRAPEGALTAELRERLTAHKAALLEHLGRADSSIPFAPSSGQKRLWFLEKMDPGGSSYAVLLGFRIEGRLRVDVLTACLDELVRRHESLRTTFEEHEGELVALVLPAAGVAMTVETGADALARVARAGGEAAERPLEDADVHAIVCAEAKEPFDLARGPLFRARLVKLGNDDHLLVLAQHHIVTDGASIAVLSRELGVFYRARVAGGPMAAETPTPFREHALREHRWLRAEASRESRRYWERQLEGMPELALPTTSEGQTTGQTSVRFCLPSDVVAAAKAWSRREGTTLFTTLCTAYVSILHRYSGQDDFGVGAVLSNRDEHSDLVGFVANTVVLRCDLRGTPSFREVAERVGRVIGQAMEHQALPYEEIVRATRRPRTGLRDPLIRASIELGTGSLAEIVAPDTTWKPVVVSADGAADGGVKFDLGLSMLETSEQFLCKLEFDPALHAYEAIERFAKHFETLLRAGLAEPATAVADLGFLTAGERRRLFREWNDTAAPFPREKCAHQLFEEQVDRTPEAVAVTFGGEQLSFAELDRRANQLAHHLRRRGVGRETLVGLCMDRSLEMAVAVLGILKAGGAYVPIDPTYPEGRVAFLRRDSGVALTVTQAKWRRGEQDLCLDEESARIAREETNRPPCLTHPEDLVYVIYTSGSTGQPKGTLITHRGLVNYLWWAVVAYGVGEGAGAPVHSSLSFDLTVTALWTPWLAGRCAELLPDASGVDALTTALTGGGAAWSLVKLTPAHLDLLDEALAGGAASGASRLLVVGGEALRPETVAGWFAAAPDTQAIVNEYGPTETVVGCCVYFAKPGERFTGSVPIGRPIANTKLYVLDARRHPVAIGLPGELFIGGEGVARGYLNRPELTAERFVPNPLADDPRDRLYRTGDLVRYRADGNLEFLGRVDHQVKVRGHRVELGEIEHVLGGHADVATCAVVLREDAPGDRRLTAYVVPREGAAPATAALREHLKAALPEYMVPAVLVTLDALPLTANGKVDRAALPAPDGLRPELGQEFVAPSTHAERELCRIWSEVLGLDRVGVHDNFFEIGGDSILSIQMASRALKAGLRLRAGDIFRHQTIAELAPTALTAAPRTAQAASGEVALTPLQRWFFDSREPDPHHWNQAVMIALRSHATPALLEKALLRVFAVHDAFRLRFVEEREGWSQRYDDVSAEPIRFEQWDLSALMPDEELAVLERRASALQASLSLARGPLARAAFIDRGTRGRSLLLVAHHLVVDGVSWRVLLEDLDAASSALAQSEAPDLVPERASMKDWGAALEAYARSPELASQKEHWYHAATAAALRLPFRRDGAKGDAITVELDVPSTQALLQQVPRAYGTKINEVLLAALVESLVAGSAVATVRVHLEAHGREEQVLGGLDVSRTVGFFSSVYPVLLERSASGIAATLRGIQETLAHVPDRGLGYGVLAALARDEVLANAPVPEVLFNYLGQLDTLHTDLGEASLTAGGTGEWQSAAADRQYAPLSVNAWIEAGKLRARWSFPAGDEPRACASAMAAAYVATLTSLVEHAGHGVDAAGGPTFPASSTAFVERAELDELLAHPEVRDDVEDVYPLSPMQEGMLFHAAYSPGSGMYVEQLGLTLAGELHADALIAAWRRAVGDHPALRTVFAWEGLRRPLQIVRRTTSLPIGVLDLRGRAPEEQVLALEELRARRRREGFDLARGPLVRLDIVRLGLREHHVLLGFHHIVLDGWSTARLLAATFADHARAVGGQAFEPTPPTMPYRQYIRWLATRDSAVAEATWRETLRGFRGATPLGLRPATGEPSGDTVLLERRLGSELTSAVTSVARKHGITAAALFQGAWALLLGKSSGERDVVFGTVTSGRPADLPGIESAVGLFVNTLPVRAELTPERPVGEWLREHHRNTAALRQLEYASLADVQAWSEVPAGAPLFESLFVFENYPMDASLGLSSGLSVAHAEGWETTNYPVNVAILPRGQELSVRLTYDPSRLEPESAEARLEHYVELVRAITAAPGARIGELSMLTARERRLTVLAWNDTTAPYPEGACLHTLFEEQASQTPDAVAVELGGASVSYRELDARANRLAHHLRALGVGVESHVGVCVERSLDMVTAVLGVLKAGGAYVPLDPGYPAERLAYIASDAKLEAVVTQRGVQHRLPAGTAQLVVLDDPETGLEARPAGRPCVHVLPDNAAYVVYTSGSTGLPKGVVGLHGAMVNRLRWMWDAFPFEPGERGSVKTSLNFLDSVWEIFGPLLRGVPSVVYDADTVRDAFALVRHLASDRITRIVLVPSLLRAMIEAAAELHEELPQLRWWTTSGEPIAPELAASFAAAFPGGTLLNLYGSSEVAADVTFHVIPRGPVSSIPIGRPIANTQVYILDSELSLVPIGVAGELCVGGAGLCRGYLNRPALTADKLIPNPFGDGRLYRTGDIARWRPDGALEYVGRVDSQVKIRGVRVELGEVEVALAKAEGVASSLVVARPDAAGDRRLVAYVVPDARGRLTPAALREAVAARLPEAMVPSAFVLLERFPLTPSGKVDRNALPAAENTLEPPRATYVAPRTTHEQLVARVFEEVLGVTGVGAEGDFFDLGGHSLRAMQAVARLYRATGVALPLRTFFDGATVARLALALALDLDAAGRPTVEDVMARIPALERSGELALSFAQERLWFLDQYAPNSAFYNVAGGLRLRGALDEAALRAAFEAIVHRHESLRTRIVSRNGRALQVVDPCARWELPVSDLRGLGPQAAEREALTRMREEASRPFSLADGPLLRTRLLRLGDGDALLSVVVHHIVSDGWSFGVLARELGVLYDAAVAGAAVELAPLPVGYVDFACWQRASLTGERLAADIAYWRERLLDVAPLDLPLDRPRPREQTFAGGEVPIRVDARTTALLESVSRGRGATLFMTLLAAFQVLLGRHAGQTDIAVGTPIAGRTRPELEGLIGFFVNTLVLRADLSDDPTFEALLDRVRSTTLGAYEHQEAPFEKLVEALEVERDPARSPLFQVMFALQNAPFESVALQGLDVAPVATATDSTRFELTLALSVAGGELVGRLEYNVDLFDRETAVALGRRYGRLLDAIAEDPRRKVGLLPMLEGAEMSLVASAGPALPRDLAPVHELIAAEARRVPDAPAVITSTGALTYGELDRRANRLAQRLVRLGVGPEVRVGLYLERSAEMVLAVLAVLKAGGAYVPLDPDYPADRVAYMLRDSGARFVVTREALVPSLALSELPGVQVVDCCAADLEGELATVPALATTPPSRIAYVIYTSGSTGKPKGVAVSHENLASSTHARFSYYRAPVRRFLLASSFSFDSSVAGLFWTLAQGGTLVVPNADDARDAVRLRELVRTHGISHLLCPPALLLTILEHARPEELASLAVTIVAGEACPTDLVRLQRERLPEVALYNEYGPTEAAVWSSVWRSEGSLPAVRVPIGRAIANAQLHVLDRHCQPVPEGTPGELFVGGSGVARGYLDRPRLTAERFVPDPFGGPAGARLYRTGDRVRRLPTGELEFLGRTDDQVKIRGYRIELGEVEAALRAHDAVREAVAVAHGQGADAKLVAYVVAQPGAALGDLRRALEQTLPESMIPSVFMELAVLPRSPNGKVDRRALPAPEASRAWLGGEFAAPRTAAETAVSAIWAEVLGVPRVGIDDNFFRLGGHSLLATQAMARMHEALGTVVPLRLLFAHPTIRQLLSAAEGVPGSTFARIPRLDERRGDLPLSFAQQRLWFLEQYEASGSSYGITAALWMDGALDVPALGRAFARLVERHEVLRTRIEARAGAPVQIIDPPGAWPMPLTDLVTEGAAADARALAMAEAYAERPFDLAKGPLFRAEIVRTGERRHLLLLGMHHIVSDGWSAGVLVRDLRAFYTAERGGRPAELPALEVQYADFAAWQRAAEHEAHLSQQVDHWVTKLEGTPVLDLPFDRPRKAVRTQRGARLRFAIDGDTTRGLRALAGRCDCTLFMTLLAGFQVLLARYTGEADVAVGSPIANRTRPELEPLIGFFVNTLVLRTDLTDDPCVLDLLARVRTTTLEAYEHQDVPFERLASAIAGERDLSRTPLFQVMFSLQNAPWGGASLDDVTMTAVELPWRTAKFDLTVDLAEVGDTLAGTLEYNTDLFDQATVERLRDHYIRLLQGMIARPSARASELPLVTDAERRLLVQTWNDTAVPFPRNSTIHACFEEHVDRAPDAVALVFEGESLTYRELDDRAEALARVLVTLGVGPEVRVALCVERSFELLIGMLGILKAGGAYVAIDPANPAVRIDFTLRDASCGIVVMRPDLTRNFELPDDVAVVDPRQEVPAVGRERERVRSLAGPDDLAQVMYTSGSTGTPKGVCLTHRNVVRISRNQSYVELGAAETFYHYATSTFDATTIEVWPSLLNGSRLVVHPPGIFDLDDFADRLKRHGVSTVWITAGLFRRMVEDRLDALLGIRQIMSGADVLSAWHVTKLLEAHPTALVINAYGPTENAVFASVFKMRSGVTLGTEVPIGALIHNSLGYVLDAHLEPVPIGVAGEMYVAGDGLARGYLDRPMTTAEKWLPNPFVSEPGARMYRTGDIVRWCKDGNLAFVGRVDHQVKVRGFRIELGEIEAALLRHERVASCVVVVREDVPGDKRVVAYVVPSEGESLGTATLRAHVGGKLPDYMIPSAFVVMAALPVTGRGKVDRRALPIPDGVADIGTIYAPPRSATEEAIASIWAEVLRLPRVGVHDNFFELGGHSLLATQVAARTRSLLAVDLPLRMLFERPTVAGLAAGLAAGSGARLEVPPLVSRPARDVLSFAQQRLWFLEQLDPGMPTYTVPVALRLTGDIDVGALRGAFEAVVSRHESLRTTFVAVAGEPRPVVHEPRAWLLPIEELAWQDEAARAAAIRERATDEAARPFSLHEGPLLRTTLLRVAPREHVLLLTMHHIVSDGWSMGVLTREVSALYAALARGEAAPLPPLPIQLGDFAAWQRELLTGELAERQLAYWRGQLAGARPLELPTDRPRPPIETHRGAAIRFEVTPALSDALRALGRSRDATLFMVLLTAFDVLLHRFAGTSDVSVGTPIANRTQKEAEGVIGCLVNTLVLRTEVDGNRTFAALLSAVKETALEAYAHQELPFDRLVEALGVERDQSRSPLFQVMFILESASSDGPLALPGLGALALPVVHHTSKFDLTLAMSESGGALSGTIEFRTDLFDAATIERIAANFTTLLAGIVEQPESRVSELPLLAPDERRLLAQWNALAESEVEESCLHALVSAQALRTPDAVAVTARGASLTYGELEARSNQLAHHLVKLGVTAEARVGICLERSLEMVVAMVAVLKSGGAYVPLDPAYPQDRLAFMLSDSGASLVVTESSLASLVVTSAGAVRAVAMDGCDLAEYPDSSPAPSVAVGPGCLAYVIYTSGSTGMPKGVAIEHRSAIALLAWAGRTFGREDWRGVLAGTSICFDLSIFEIFGTLSVGGTVHVARSALELPELGAGQSITLMNTVPSLMAELVREGAVPSTVRVVNLAGEALTDGLVQAVYGLGHVERVYDLYGPSEDTTYSTMALRAKGAGSVTTIGRPIAGTSLYIVDAAGDSVPIGVAGEICLGGRGLARGYLGRPELTAERFVELAAASGQRVYRTGDRGRFLADGNVVYLGRLDHQVKVRGFRIELGEVEAALLGCAGVREAVVLAREDAPGDKRLVAYVVAEEGVSLDPASLRGALRAKLPEPMVASAFVVLDAMPRTPNGKLDRAALPAPALHLHAGAEPPRDATELRLVALWEELLGRAPIGVRDGFFEVGGHSLLAVRLMARIRRDFARDLPLSTLFTKSTIEQLANELRKTPGAPRTSCLVPIEPAGEGAPLFCIHPIGGGVLCFAALARAMGRARPVYGLEAAGLLSDGAPDGTVEAMAARYVREIQAVQKVGPYHLVGYSVGGVIAHAVADALLATGEDVASLVLLDAWAPSRIGPIDPLVELARELRLSVDLSHLRGLAVDEALAGLLEHAREARALPGDIALPDLRRIHAVITANARAVEAYVPRRGIISKVTLLRAADAEDDGGDATLGWAEILGARLELRVTRGDHLTMLAPPHVAATADALRRALS